MSSYHINGLPLVPSVFATFDGDLLLVKEYSSIDSYEKIARMIASQTSGLVFIIESPVKVTTASQVSVVGSITRALNLGVAVRAAIKNGDSAAQTVADQLNGYVIFKGEVSNHKLVDEKGFLSGNIQLTGIESHKNKKLKIWIKNENIIAWLDDKPVVLPPDLIIVMGEEGYPVVNSDIQIGMKVEVVAAPGHEIFRSPKGLEVIGPKHFGFDLEFQPVEKLVKNI